MVFPNCRDWRSTSGPFLYTPVPDLPEALLGNRYGVGEKREGGPWGLFPAAARAEVERDGLATTIGGRRSPWAGILEARRRSRRWRKARGDREGSTPYLGLG